MIEPEYRVKIATFFLDQAADVKAYEAIRNNVNCTIIKRESVMVREVNKEYDEGKLISSEETQRIQWIVEYEEKKLPEK